MQEPEQCSRSGLFPEGLRIPGTRPCARFFLMFCRVWRLATGVVQADHRPVNAGWYKG